MNLELQSTAGTWRCSQQLGLGATVNSLNLELQSTNNCTSASAGPGSTQPLLDLDLYRPCWTWINSPHWTWIYTDPVGPGSTQLPLDLDLHSPSCTWIYTAYTGPGSTQPMLDLDLVTKQLFVSLCTLRIPPNAQLILFKCGTVSNHSYFCCAISSEPIVHPG